jgi:hypothetical protein
MVAVVEVEVCSSTRRSVDKAGRETPDMAEEGSLARQVKAPLYLCGRAKCLDALVAEEHG